MRVHAQRAGALLGGLMFPAWSMADWTLNMTPGVTGTSNDIFSLHMTILWICVAIGVVVFGVMFWSIFAHRKSQGAKPANFHENTMVEILWTRWWSTPGRIRRVQGRGHPWQVPGTG